MEEEKTKKSRDVAEISWQTREHPHLEKSSDWYWALGILAAALTIAAAIFGNFTFAIIIVIGSFALALVVSKKPKKIKVELNQKGIKINNALYLYKNLEGFWIEKESKKIIIKSKKTLMPMIVVPIDEQIDPDEIEAYLIQFLHEEELDEPFYSKISDVI